MASAVVVASLAISSVAGLDPMAGSGLYAAAKCALEGISQALAQKVSPLGIKVMLIEPGGFRTDFLSDHSIRVAVGETWASLDPDLPTMIVRQMYRRLIFTLSEARHGGAIIMVPQERTEEILAGKHVTLKHNFADGEPRRRLKTLIVGIMNRLARSLAGSRP
ncbi:MAG: SDR family NAD(P)-dependent oxidoreductase [Rubrobacter sp.]|nr:SDR family NAD(P)-dependent oxidoreductase [Rubrobacter sp.]